MCLPGYSGANCDVVAETPETCELPSCIGDTTETGVDGLETTICVDNAQAYYPNVALVGGPNRLEQENVAGSLVVHDRVSGLTWTGCPSGLTGNRCQTGTLQSKSYSQQQNYCRDLNWAGHTDWFAPTDADWRRSESDSQQHSTDPAVFQNTPNMSSETDTIQATRIYSLHLGGYVFE